MPYAVLDRASSDDGGPDESPVSSAELYDPSNGTFTATTNSMSSARAIATATLLPNGEVLIAGGENNSGKPESSTDLYTP
ncbi:MAG: kelch repeat-containing protein [Candidatus Binataceae bacterium]